MHNKKHLDLKGAESDLKGAESLINIIVSMNKGRTDKILSNFPGILPIVLLKISSLTINNVSVDWFVGFTDAEGCFLINTRSNRKRNGYWASAGFSIVQHNRDILLFNLLKKFVGGGFIIEEINKNVVRLRGESLSFILEIIIPLFNNNPLQSSKLKDYWSFCSACQLIKNKAHLTEEGGGVTKINDLKNNMNRGRKYISKGFQRN